MENKKDVEISYDNCEYYNNLSELEKRCYLSLYKKYLFILLEYFEQNLNLSVYDKAISDIYNKYNFIDEEKTDYYENICVSKYKKIFFRNNLFIENLNEEEKDCLNNIKKYDMDSKIFIEKTLDKILFKRNSTAKNILYSPLNSDLIVESNSIVFEICLNKYLLTNNEKQNISLKEKKNIVNSIENITSLMEIDIENKIKRKVRVIKC